VTPIIVCQIRDLYEHGGITQSQLCGQFSLSRNSISNIIRRKSWSHIK
jgi:transcriptional regulator with XRE-family HTH domain